MRRAARAPAWCSPSPSATTPQARRSLPIAKLSWTAALLAGAGLALAAWTTNGSGNASAAAGTGQALATVDASAATTATLFPGAVGDVVLEIENPNPYPVRVTSVTADGPVTADSSHPGCAPTGVTFTDQAGLSIDIPATSRRQTTLNGAARMSNASVDACQGATFTVPIAISGVSGAPG